MSTTEPDSGALDGRETVAVERRRATEHAMWTIPGASDAAQAFLYTRGLDPATGGLARMPVAVVGPAAALATIQILVEQRYERKLCRLFVHAKRRDRG